ncbi:MAG: response regulator transcription factor [Acidimicrobiia bacterium]
MRVLIIEDHDELADGIARALRRNALAVDLAGDGGTALDKFAANEYDVVVLDRNLPVVHGDDVCRTIVQQGARAKVIMLTASGTLNDKVEGFSIGADDYLAKPFAMEELVARIRALGRRTSAALPPVLRRGEITLDPGRRIAARDGRDLRLTNREFALLEHLITIDGGVASAEELMERVWDDRLDPFSNVVRVTILTLRRKVGDPPIIETVPGVGYRLV